MTSRRLVDQKVGEYLPVHGGPAQLWSHGTSGHDPGWALSQTCPGIHRSAGSNTTRCGAGALSSEPARIP